MNHIQKSFHNHELLFFVEDFCYGRIIFLVWICTVYIQCRNIL